MLQQRLQKCMDEYAGGVSTWYLTSGSMLDEGFKYLDLIKEDSLHMCAETCTNCCGRGKTTTASSPPRPRAAHALPRGDRYPGYYYRGDHLAIDDKNWKCFVNSVYDRQTKTWTVFKKPTINWCPDGRRCSSVRNPLPSLRVPS